MSPDLDAVVRELRGKVVEMSHAAQTPHLGSSLSCADIIAAAYWHALKIDPAAPEDDDRDRFILSKGHAVSTLYAALAMRGFFEEDLLATYNEPGSRLAEQPAPHCVPGVEAATGSLGHGLPIGVGAAIGNRLRGLDGRVYVLMSDGECNEGSVWEAAMFAPAQGLERLMAIVDYNKWQATGRSDETMALAPLAEKFEAFGWDAFEVDGHDLGALADVLERLPNGSGKPVAVVAHTVKGRGISFMEDDNNWHYRSPTADEVQAARAELGLALA